jgi:hypothetical protein
MQVDRSKLLKAAFIFLFLVVISLLIPRETGLRAPFVVGGFIVGILSVFRRTKA